MASIESAGGINRNLNQISSEPNESVSKFAVNGKNVKVVVFDANASDNQSDISSSASSDQWMNQTKQYVANNFGQSHNDNVNVGGQHAQSQNANALTQANLELHTRLEQQKIDGSSNASEIDGDDFDANDLVTPDELEIHAPGSRAVRRLYTAGLAILGAIGGGVAGFLAGSAVPIFGNIAGGVGGIIGGALAGIAAGSSGGLVAGSIHLKVKGGQGQQEHVEQAKASLAAQGVVLTPQDVERLNDVSPKEWRKLLHIPRKAVKDAYSGHGAGMSKKEQRQAIREAIILTVARRGKSDGEELRTHMLSDNVDKRLRSHQALKLVQAQGGNIELRRAFKTHGQEGAERMMQRHENNRENWDNFSDELNARFGQHQPELMAKFEEVTKEKYDLGKPLTQADKDKWIGAAKHGYAAGALLNRIQNEWPQGVNAARAAAEKQLKQFEEGQAGPSGRLVHSGRLSPRETEDILNAAWQAQLEATDSYIDDLNLLSIDDFLEQENDTSEIQRALLTQNGVFRKDVGDAYPTDLFAHNTGMSIYKTCEQLTQLDRDDTLFLLGSGDQQIDSMLAARFDHAQDLAELGNLLKQQGLDEAVAGELLRMEMSMRMANAGPPRDGIVSPQLAHDEYLVSPEALKIATDNAAKRAAIRNEVAQDPALQGVKQEIVDEAVNKLLVFGGAFSGQLQSLDNLTDPSAAALMANNAAGLKAAIKAGVNVDDVIKNMRVLGKPDSKEGYEEAISCIKLGVLPQYLAQIDDRNGQRTQQQAQEALALKTWTDQGFNRAEAKSYLTSVRQPDPTGQGNAIAPDPTNPEIKAFQGSNLKPRIVQQYLDYGITYNELTAPSFFTDEHRVGVGHSDQGSINKVYMLSYKTPSGVKQRFFKSATPELNMRNSDPGKLIGANLGMNVIDKELGFGVIVDTKVGVHNGQLGISMENAGKYDADKLANHGSFGSDAKAFFTLPRNDRDYQAIYQILDAHDGQLPKQDAEILEKRYGVYGARVNEDGDIEVARDFYAEVSDDPVMREKTVGLQILDYLGKVGDRNKGNYVPQVQGDAGNLNVVGVKGVDNDDAFDAMNVAQRPVGLPRVMSQSQVDAINRMYANKDNNDGVLAKLRKVIKPSSNDKELKGFEQRLESLHKYVNGGRHGGQKLTIIPNDQWGSDQTGALLNNKSLIARDRVVFAM